MYDYIIMEVKLSIYSLKALIEQLKRDQIMSAIIGRPIIYIGFLNINKGDEAMIKSFDFPKIYGTFECIIFGIKNGVFSERNILHYIDWKIVSQIKEMKEFVISGFTRMENELRKTKN